LGRLVEAIFRRQSELIRGLLEQHFAFDAEQLRGVPAMPILAGDRRRVIKDNKSLVESLCPGKA
jgi:hypothetical protein